MEKQADLKPIFSDEEKAIGYDAIVVGSGYGGSVASCRMAKAGIKICLLEKGKKWEAKDFPTDSLKMISNARVEDRGSGLNYGPKDALFQVFLPFPYSQELGVTEFQLHRDGDSVAFVACGLGGGSLINAGVMIPTPVRAKRNPKWPKEWERDWDHCEDSAASMLTIQSVPVKFPATKFMEEMIKEEIEEISEVDIKVSVNFGNEEPPSDLINPSQMGRCIACGNCLAGCPYNAKTSNDKNYILSAIQAGCVVKTQCQVQYVVKNPYESLNENKTGRKRRWFVYLNEVDYITADFVILSAGVLGTTEILFRSQMRGLKLSDALGSGFSCNGNNVGYLAGSPAPLNSYGLDRKEIQEKPFEERPGPAISSSYTSSLGFTIQSAVLPTAYPYLLFKGIGTYGWPTGYWFFHGIVDKLKSFIDFKSSQAMALNAMGYDGSDGKIIFDKSTNRIRFSPPHDPLLPRKIEAFQKITNRLGGILFMSRCRSTSVHLLGGCNASSDPSHGVCNPSGQVFDPEVPAGVHPGLYVCDASLIPCSVGVNPSLTITAAAEHVNKHLVKYVLDYKSKQGIQLIKTIEKNLSGSSVSVVVVKETMNGHIGGMPCTAYLIMKMNSLSDQKNVDEWNSVIGESHPLLRGKVGGFVLFPSIEKDKLHIIDGRVDLCQVDNKTPYTQYMHYRLLLASSSGFRYILEGKKIMNPFLFALYAWKESTTLHVTFKKFSGNSSQVEVKNLTGKLRISMKELLKSIMSLEGDNKRRFLSLFSQTLLRTYVLQIPRGHHSRNLPDSCHEPYPESILHKIKAEDGYIVSCRQWKCSETQRRLNEEKQLNPVLLVNAYVLEGYWLPSEPNDLVRTLLKEGHEIWLLQSRLHPANPANDFVFDDIGRFDIPAAIRKILEIHGESTKVHVAAHCAGGLSVHIALMGGHVSATNIASLTCINSSMYFKLTPFSTFKMQIPLLPVSLAIIGKNKIVSLDETSKSSFRHQLFKWIANCIPRNERCTCRTCEVFSGIFGNAFLHKNISVTMHEWLTKQSTTTMIPMAGLIQIRKIINKGFIVDSNGNNSYLIHPERMAVSTKYISGGESIFITPETTFLAHKYMKLHQPGFRHERVVMDGFGHSDLLIGEESSKKVFPHILSHIRLAERGENIVKGEQKKYSEEVLAWKEDSYGRFKGFQKWFSPWILIWVMISGLLVLISLFM